MSIYSSSAVTPSTSIQTITMSNINPQQQNVAHVKPMPISVSASPGVSLLSSSTTQRQAGTNTGAKAQLYQSVNVNVNGVVKSVLIPLSPGTSQPQTPVASSPPIRVSVPRTGASPSILRIPAPTAKPVFRSPVVQSRPTTTIVQRPIGQPIITNAVQGLNLGGGSSRFFLGTDGKMYMQVEQPVKTATTPQASPSIPVIITPPQATPQAKPAPQTVIRYTIGPPKDTGSGPSTLGTVNSIVPQTKTTEPVLKIDSVFSLSPEKDTSTQQKVIEIAPIDESKSQVEKGSSVIDEADDIVLNISKGMAKGPSAQASEQQRQLEAARAVMDKVTAVHSIRHTPSSKTITVKPSITSPLSTLLQVRPTGSLVTGSSVSGKITFNAYPGPIQTSSSSSVTTKPSLPGPIFKSMITGQPPRQNQTTRFPLKSPTSSETGDGSSKSTMWGLLDGKVVRGIKRPMDLTSIPRKHKEGVKKTKPSSEPTIMNYCHVVLEKFPKLKRKKRYKMSKVEKLWKNCPKCPMALREKKLAKLQLQLEQEEKEKQEKQAKSANIHSQYIKGVITPGAHASTSGTQLPGRIVHQPGMKEDPKGKYLLIKTNAGSFLVPMQQKGLSQVKGTPDSQPSLQKNQKAHQKAKRSDVEVKHDEKASISFSEVERNDTKEGSDEKKEEEKTEESASDRIKRLKEMFKQQQEQLQEVNKRREETKKLLEEMDDD